MMMSRTSLFAVLIVSFAATSARPAYASGYYNMPTSLSQCLGLGYGPGYHAPLMLSRSYKAKTATQRVRRMPAPLPPPASSLGAHRAYGMSTTDTWATPCEGGSCGGTYLSCEPKGLSGEPTGGHGPISEGNRPAFAAPTLFAPQQVAVPEQTEVPQYFQPTYQGPTYLSPGTGPHFPSARAQKPALLW